MPAFVSENIITKKQGEILSVMHLHFDQWEEQTQKAAHGVHAQQGCMCNKGIVKRMKKPVLRPKIHLPLLHTTS